LETRTKNLPVLPNLLLATIFLGSFSGYSLTLNPSLFRNDSPETITACVTLGIPHSPSYPLHDLLGHLFLLVFKVGNPAMALNFFSAFLGALGACLFAWNLWVLLQRSGASNHGKPYLLQAACLITSFAFAFSKSYWSASLSAKGGVYIFQMVLILALLLVLQTILLPSEGHPSPVTEKKLFFPAFLFSIGLLNHWPTQMLLLPAALLVGFLYFRFSSVNKNFKFEIKPSIQIVCFSLLALSGYLYLPLRSNLYPHLNFGAPFTSGRFLDSVLRISYFKVETMISAPATEFQTLLEKTNYLSNSLFNEFSGFFVFFIPMGVYFMLVHGRKKSLLFLLGVLMVTLWANVFYLRVIPIEFWHLNDHLLGANWALAFCGGYGLANALISLIPLAPTKSHPILLMTLTLFVVITLPFLSLRKFLTINDQSNEFVYRGYGMALLRSMDKNPCYFAESDYDLFSLAYLTDVEGKRLDLHLFWTSMLDRGFESQLVKHQYPDLHWNSSLRNLIPELIQNHIPIYCAFSNGPFESLVLDLQMPFYFQPTGMTIHAFPDSKTDNLRTTSSLNEFWQRYLKPTKRSPNPINGILQELCAHPYINMANYLKLSGDLSNWDQLYDRALTLIQENQWLGDEWSARGDGDSLLGNRSKAIGSYLTAAGIYLRIGQKDKALDNFRKAALLDPADTDLKHLSTGLIRS